MKKMFSVGLLVLIALTAVVMVGCTTSTTTVSEFNADGKIIKKTVTDEKDAFDKVIKSTKNKTIVMWSNGWAAYIVASPANAENPTPSGKIYAGKVSKGYASILKDQKNLGGIAQIIMATKEDVKVDMSGVSSESSTKDTPDAKENDAASEANKE